MNTEGRSASKLASPRNLLIAGALLLVIGASAVMLFIARSNHGAGVADASSSPAGQAPAGDHVKSTGTAVSDKDPLNVISYGSSNAPITIIEYGSLACPHCAEFEEIEFPKIKESYIDKGLVYFVFRPLELPMFNGVDVYAALLVTCMQPQRRTAMLEMLYRQQRDWVPYDTPPDQMKDKLFASLKDYGHNAGLSDEAVDKCLNNEVNQNWLGALNAQADKDGVDGTPKFFINGEMSGNMSFEDWQKKLNGILAKKRS